MLTALHALEYYKIYRTTINRVRKKGRTMVEKMTEKGRRMEAAFGSVAMLVMLAIATAATVAAWMWLREWSVHGVRTEVVPLVFSPSKGWVALVSRSIVVSFAGLQETTARASRVVVRTRNLELIDITIRISNGTVRTFPAVEEVSIALSGEESIVSIRVEGFPLLGESRQLSVQLDVFERSRGPPSSYTVSVPVMRFEEWTAELYLVALLVSIVVALAFCVLYARAVREAKKRKPERVVEEI
jgi:hypothetical protein